MQRIGVLNGNSITYDHDISALVRGLTDWGVIEWGLISDNKVLAPIQAIVSAQRSNGQKLLLHFESDEQIQLPTSWSYKVYIEVDQSKIDDGQANAENGTGIASIKTGENLPSKNVLQIAKVTNGQIEQRTLIPKLQSLSQRTSTLEEKFETAKPGIDAASKMPEKIKLLEASVNKLTTVNGIRQELDFKVEGRASATWNAPENGLLEYKFSRQGNSGSAALGDMDLPVRSWENIPNYLFVQKGQQIFLSVDNNYRQGLYKIQLTAFIPL